MSETYEMLVANPRAPRMVGGKPMLGDGFRQWMNRPLARVQVYSWRLAVLLNPEQPGASIRVLRAYRTPGIKDWRKTTAAAMKIARRGGKVFLPVYSENMGRYMWRKES